MKNSRRSVCKLRGISRLALYVVDPEGVSLLIQCIEIDSIPTGARVIGRDIGIRRWTTVGFSQFCSPG